MPKELTMEVVRGCFYTPILIGRLNGRTAPVNNFTTTLLGLEHDSSLAVYSGSECFLQKYRRSYGIGTTFNDRIFIFG